MNVYKLPESYTQWIDKYLRTLGFNVSQSQHLAKAILQVSNDYQEIASTTPWSDAATLAAYLSYYFPLNYVRALKVIEEGKRWEFFKDVKQIVDFGCGPGTVTKALLHYTSVDFESIHGIDVEPALGTLFLDVPRKKTQLTFNDRAPTVKPEGSLLVASYVINELKTLPPWFFNFEKIMIIEPSTKQAFPSLLEMRQELLDRNYQIVAPCTHVHDCPMKKSKRDWCHDRVHWQQPDWFQKIENQLPIKNKTLTFSYLLASKTPVTKPDFGRVVGDPQIEKGKTRWMFCQSPDREFLSFLKRQGKTPEIQRGDRVQLKIHEKKGDEIRFDPEHLKKI